MKNILIGIGIGIVAVILLAVVIGYKAPTQGTLGAEIPMVTTFAYSSSTATSTGATLVLAADSSASIRRITNLTAGTAYLSFGTSTGLTAQTGFALPASTTLEMTEGNGNLLRQAIYVISDTGQTPKLSVFQSK